MKQSLLERRRRQDGVPEHAIGDMAHSRVQSSILSQVTSRGIKQPVGDLTQVTILAEQRDVTLTAGCASHGVMLSQSLIGSDAQRYVESYCSYLPVCETLALALAIRFSPLTSDNYSRLACIASL